VRPRFKCTCQRFLRHFASNLLFCFNVEALVNAGPNTGFSGFATKGQYAVAVALKNVAKNSGGCRRITAVGGWVAGVIGRREQRFARLNQSPESPISFALSKLRC
jgi:hypothetical protein